MFRRRRLLVTNRLPVCEHFGADIITLVMTSPKRIVTVLSPSSGNFENSQASVLIGLKNKRSFVTDGRLLQ